MKLWELHIPRGADVAVRRKDHKSAMHLAIEHTKMSLEKLQNSYMYPLDRIENLSEIAVGQCIDEIKFLFHSNKHLVMIRDGAGNTLFHLLADHESFNHDKMVSIARTLIDSGSKVNIANAPLHLDKSWSMAKSLLEHGAIPNVSDNMGCSPLICRCKTANLETLSKRPEGMTFGMDPWKEDSEGQNVFTILMKKATFADLDAFISVSVKKERETILGTDSKGNTLLHNLCHYNDSRVKPFNDLLLGTAPM